MEGFFNTVCKLLLIHFLTLAMQIHHQPGEVSKHLLSYDLPIRVEVEGLV